MDGASKSSHALLLRGGKPATGYFSKPPFGRSILLPLAHRTSLFLERVMVHMDRRAGMTRFSIGREWQGGMSQYLCRKILHPIRLP